ncbi:DUF881 domain-containing protein [Lysinibacillus piscis]|uniref:UPF0749 protein YlxX n=1 Tax=Lysinibacillus piscis TaxID=2518931 RepID=A0ABQ5NGR3_9BACI|nr:DUF881 domain-containing protein [Lysinibacillus sp. KH24]GLC87550.1 UPF0749 protein YlxX [Lysinibacillus sp. KH24]
MKKNMYTRITLVLFIIGLMIAVQYNTIQQPAERDTRDIWDIREELSMEKQRHSTLLEEIRSLHEVVDRYEQSEKTSLQAALSETVNRLQTQAGLTKVVGPGLILRIEAAPELIEMGYVIREISPDLLTQLLNELFKNNAIDVAIDGNRVVQTTAIRDINGRTTVNSVPISSLPFEIYVGTSSFKEAQKMYNSLQASSLVDSFYLDNFNLVIEEPMTQLTISAFDQPLTNDYLTEVEKGE